MPSQLLRLYQGEKLWLKKNEAMQRRGGKYEAKQLRKQTLKMSSEQVLAL